jgi:hypothetical protein
MARHLKHQVGESEGNLNSLLDVWAGHSSRTAGMEYPRSTKDHQQVSNNREAMHQFFLASKEWQLLSPEESEMGREPRSVSVYCRNTELRLRVTSQYRCTGNADSLNRIAMACRWGFINTAALPTL